MINFARASGLLFLLLLSFCRLFLGLRNPGSYRFGLILPLALMILVIRVKQAIDYI